MKFFAALVLIVAAVFVVFTESGAQTFAYTAAAVAGFFLGLAAIFAVGGLGFLLAVPILIVLLLWEIAYDLGLTATLTFAGFLVFLNLAGVPIWQTAAAHPYWAVAAVLLYFVLGALTSVYLWDDFGDRCMEAYDRMKDKFFDEQEVSIPADRRVPERLKMGWEEHVARWYHIDDEPVMRASHSPMPDLYQYGSKLQMWILVWPASLVWHLIRDLVKKIYRKMQRIYQWVMERKFQNAMGDFLTVEEERQRIQGRSRERRSPESR